jgi:hypothetical protein
VITRSVVSRRWSGNIRRAEVAASSHRADLIAVPVAVLLSAPVLPVDGVLPVVPPVLPVPVLPVRVLPVAAPVLPVVVLPVVPAVLPEVSEGRNSKAFCAPTMRDTPLKIENVIYGGGFFDSVDFQEPDLARIDPVAQTHPAKTQTSAQQATAYASHMSLPVMPA